MAWVTSLVSAVKEDAQLRTLSQRFSFELQDAMANLTLVMERLRVVESAQRATEELQRREPENSDYVQDLHDRLQQIG